MPFSRLSAVHVAPLFGCCLVVVVVAAIGLSPLRRRVTETIHQKSNFARIRLKKNASYSRTGVQLLSRFAHL